MRLHLTNCNLVVSIRKPQFSTMRNFNMINCSLFVAFLGFNSKCRNFLNLLLNGREYLQMWDILSIYFIYVCAALINKVDLGYKGIIKIQRALHKIFTCLLKRLKKWERLAFGRYRIWFFMVNLINGTSY